MPMLFIIAFMFSLTHGANNLIDTAIENYKDVDSYQVTLSITGNGTSEKIKYYFKKPGYVKMEFIKPHKGAVLVYNPTNKKVRLRPLGFLKFFILTLNPGSILLKSSKSHRVNESDIGSLLNIVKKLQSHGTSQKLKDETVGKRRTVLISVEGKGDFAVNGIHLYYLWFDKKIFLPLKVSAYNTQGKLIEEVLMDDLQINIEFPEDFFDL